jgi:hypothetical protein
VVPPFMVAIGSALKSALASRVVFAPFTRGVSSMRSMGSGDVMLFRRWRPFLGNANGTFALKKGGL